MLLAVLTGLCDVLRHPLLRSEGPLALQADMAGVVVGGGQAGLLPPGGGVAATAEVLEEAAGGLAYEPKFGIRTDFCAKSWSVLRVRYLQCGHMNLRCATERCWHVSCRVGEVNEQSS